MGEGVQHLGAVPRHAAEGLPAMSAAKRVRLGAFALVALLLAAAVAQADECQDQDAAGLTAVPASSLIPVPPTSLCYGAAGETNALTQEIRRLVDQTPP